MAIRLPDFLFHFRCPCGCTSALGIYPGEATLRWRCINCGRRYVSDRRGETRADPPGA